jgi:hypothetical protein
MQSAYRYTPGHELTPRNRKPARHTLKAWYLHQLHWQFLSVAAVLYLVLFHHLVTTFRFLSFRFLFSLLALGMIARILLVPCFHLLKGYISPPWRLTLSLSFTLILFVATSSIWISHWGAKKTPPAVATPSLQSRKPPDGIPFPTSEPPRNTQQAKPAMSGTQTQISHHHTTQPAFSVVEFQLIPYARVYDVSAGSPRFLVETHYKTVQVESGRRVLRFDYQGRSYTMTIFLRASERHVMFVDMHTGRYHIK